MVTRNQWLAIGAVAVFGALTYGAITSKSDHSQIGATTHDKAVWKMFKPQSGRFEVLLPAIPQHVSEAHPKGDEFTKYDVYLSQDREGNVYMISLTQYPQSYEMGSVDDVLEAVKNGAMGSNTKNELKNEERSTYLNFPALDFAINSKDSQIRSKVIVADKMLIVLTAMNRDDSHLDSDFKTFAGSFVLKDIPAVGM
ncbi:MAG: hypothetical protein LLF94_06680 [Chlamydiales bacterium]|nr:hypothetical protein [Chlamydiales bacterium]